MRVSTEEAKVTKKRKIMDEGRKGLSEKDQEEEKKGKINGGTQGGGKARRSSEGTTFEFGGTVGET